MARGDHLYYFRAGGTYSHHALDCGDGSVIHYESSPWMKLASGWGSPQAVPTVKRASMAEFSQGNAVIVRSYDGVAHVDDHETAIRRAESRLGEACYDLVGNNCEHFVVWCKTGVAESSQVTAHRNATKMLLHGAPVGALLLRAAKRVPGPYRRVATLGALAFAGAVYVNTYLQHRVKQMDAGLS